MAAHQLKPNPSKTELLFIPADSSPCPDLAIIMDNWLTPPSLTARNLWVINCPLPHVANLTRSLKMQDLHAPKFPAPRTFLIGRCRCCRSGWSVVRLRFSLLLRM